MKIDLCWKRVRVIKDSGSKKPLAVTPRDSEEVVDMWQIIGLIVFSIAMAFLHKD